MNNKFLYKLKRYLTLDGYSVAPVYIQLIVLLMISFLIITLFSFYYGSFEDSYDIFMDPTSIPKGNIVVTIFILLLGIMISCFIISILSSALENFIGEIKKGILPFKRSNHLVYINSNSKLFYILNELNTKYKEINEIKEIVIIVSDENEVTSLLKDIEDYSNLSIFIKYGNLYEKETYIKFGLHRCENITILQDEKIEQSFQSDNNSIKILSTIIQDTNIDFNRINITLESNSTYFSDSIIESISNLYNIKRFSYINPDKLLGQLLTRSMIDVIYYKIYEQIFSFNGYELYIKNASNFLKEEQKFKDLLLNFNNSILIGYIRDNNVKLNDLEASIRLDDKLIFLATDEKHIQLEAKTKTPTDIIIKINEPSEIVSKRICMIGNNLKVENLFEFLDEDSKKAFTKYEFEDISKYFDKNFISFIKKQNFDSIIINLDEEYTLRFILALVAIYGKNDAFVNNCISIITDPNSAKIINEITGKSNIILSQRLSAQFISQLSFDENLINIINELTTSKGAEFNIINTKEENLSNFSKEELKYHLIKNNMTYIGLVKNNNEVVLNGNNIKESKYIIVLSEGEN